ncbi:MAG: hypothetical protein A4E33_01528 [Methanoregula sp. PtaB.Bin085]|nr:MAG: hypothetical protein A4E33_01528 [Methanoregula sp. PtaB.Bin085]
MTLEDARDWIGQIAAYRDKYVWVLSLTGGEPFSNVPLLRAVMEIAGGYGFYTSVVTNGFWATSQEKAVQVLKSLPQICFLSVSTDVYHEEFIPLENVKNVIRAATECNIPYYVSVITENREEPGYRRIHAELLDLVGDPDKVMTGITFPVGRAMDQGDKLKYRMCSTPCHDVCTAASSPCIFPDGSVYGCIGPLIDLKHDQPLYLGSLRKHSVAEIFEKAETHSVLHALRLWGPAKIWKMLRDAGLGDRIPAEFVADSNCQACYALLADPAIRDWLQKLETDPDFRRKVAYGRLYYLEETGMLEYGGF